MADDPHNYDVEFWQRELEELLLKAPTRVIKCSEAIAIFDGWIDSLEEFVQDEFSSRRVSTQDTAYDFWQVLKAFLEGGKALIGPTAIPIPLSMRFSGSVQLAAGLSQKKSRRWGLFIQIKRGSKSRSPKRNRECIRVPHR